MCALQWSGSSCARLAAELAWCCVFTLRAAGFWFLSWFSTSSLTPALARPLTHPRFISLRTLSAAPLALHTIYSWFEVDLLAGSSRRVYSEFAGWIWKMICMNRNCSSPVCDACCNFTNYPQNRLDLFQQFSKNPSYYMAISINCSLTCQKSYLLMISFGGLS